MLSKVQKKAIYDAIEEAYEYGKDICYTITEDDVYDPDAKAEIASALIEQLTESNEEVIDGYLDFLDHNEKASAKEVRKVEGAMRKVFACAADALDKIKNIKPLKQKANCPHVELLDISHNEVLPSVGYVDKQVEPSIIANELQAEAVRLPEHADFIQALQNLVTHYSRLAYCFLRIKLVREIHNILFGKIIAKAKAMAILEKERIKQVAVLQAQGVLGAHASAVSSQRRDGYSLEH